MYFDSESQKTIECWNQLANTLAAGPRRQIILALLNSPEGRRLPLPDAATVPAMSIDSKQYALVLKHSHLPKLAEGGYVQWSNDPFCVQRGPRFEEPEAVFRILLASRDQLPSTLWNESMEQRMGKK